MSHWRLRVCLAVLIVGGPGVGIASAAPPITEARLVVEGKAYDVWWAAGRWEYRFHEPLGGGVQVVNRQLEQRRGTRVWVEEFPGCRFEIPANALVPASATQGLVRIEREVSYSSEECLSTFETGWVEAGLSPESQFEAADSDWAGIASSYQYTGFIRGYTMDPPGIYLANTWSHAQWSWSGSCVTNSNRWPAYSSATWITWNRIGSWSTAFGTSCQPGLEVLGTYKGTFWGGVGNPTYTQHIVRFQVTGPNQGSTSYSLIKWGYMSYLLSTGVWRTH